MVLRDIEWSAIHAKFSMDASCAVAEVVEFVICTSIFIRARIPLKEAMPYTNAALQGGGKVATIKKEIGQKCLQKLHSHLYSMWSREGMEVNLAQVTGHGD